MIKSLFKKLIRKSPDIIDLRSKKEISINTDSVLLPNCNFDNRVKLESRVYVTIGKKCIIGATFTFETSKGEIVIGDNVHLGQVHFICRTRIEIANDVTMAWGITLYDHDSHSIDWDIRKFDNGQCYDDYLQYNGNNIVNKDWSFVKSKPIKIENKVWIGFDVLVLKGVTIGEGAVVGAKSVVTKDVPAWTVVAGNPARVVRHLEKPENL